MTHRSVLQIIHFAVQEDSTTQLGRHIRRIDMVFEEGQWIGCSSGFRLRQVVIGLGKRRRKLVPEAFRKGVEWVSTMRLEGCKQRTQCGWFQNAVRNFTS
jgi:hypothetical protein